MTEELQTDQQIINEALKCEAMSTEDSNLMRLRTRLPSRLAATTIALSRIRAAKHLKRLQQEINDALDGIMLDKAVAECWRTKMTKEQIKANITTEHARGQKYFACYCKCGCGWVEKSSIKSDLVSTIEKHWVEQDGLYYLNVEHTKQEKSKCT